ncbi:MAG: DUF4403 family protein [Bacteroidota bacterium]
MNITRLHIQLPIDEIAAVTGQYLDTHKRQLLARQEQSFMRARDWRDLRIEGKGDHLKTRLLVRFETRLMGEVPSVLRNLGQSMGVETLDFELEIFLHTRVWLDEHWGLKTASMPRYDWRKKAQLGFSLLKLNVTSLLSPFIDRALTVLAAEVDEAIQRLIPLSRWIKDAWKTGQQAIVLPASIPCYLLLRPHPTMLKLAPIQATETHVETYLSLALQPLLRLGPLVERTTSWSMPQGGEISPEEEDVTGGFRIDYHTLGAFLSEIQVPLGNKGSSLHVLELRLAEKDGLLTGQGKFRLFLQRGRFSTTVGRPFTFDSRLISADPYPQLQLKSLQIGKGNWWQKRMMGKPERLRHRVEDKINHALQKEWDYWQTFLQERLADLPLTEGLNLQIKENKICWEHIEFNRREVVGTWKLRGQPRLAIALPQDWLSEEK